MSILTHFAVWYTDWQYNKILKRMEDETMTYKLMKRVIENGLKKGNLNVEDTMQKLDVFLIANRITIEEYQELVAMIEEGTTND